MRITTIDGEIDLSRRAFEEIASMSIIRMRREIPKHRLWEDTFLVRQRVSDNFYARTVTLVNTIAMTMEIADSASRELLFNRKFVSSNWDLCFQLADWKSFDSTERQLYQQATAGLATSLGDVRDEHRLNMKLWTALAASIPQVGAARALQSSSAEHGEKRNQKLEMVLTRIDARRVPLMQRFRRHVEATSEMAVNLDKAIERLQQHAGNQLDIQLEQTVIRPSKRLVHRPWSSKARKVRGLIQRAIRFFMRGDRDEALESLEWARVIVAELDVYAELAELYFWFVPEFRRTPRNRVFVEAMRLELGLIAERLQSPNHLIFGSLLGEKLRQQIADTCAAWDRGYSSAGIELFQAKEEYRMMLSLAG